MIGSKLRKERGISLLEVLVSMLILGFGILGLAPMIVLSIEGNSIAREFSEASELAKERLEQYEAMDTIVGFPINLTEDSISGRYTRLTTCIDSASDSTIPGDLCKVTVVISWVDESGTNRSSSFSTLMDKVK